MNTELSDEIITLRDEIKWCTEWLDVGPSIQAQENQMMVLEKLVSMKERLDKLLGMKND